MVVKYGDNSGPVDLSCSSTSFMVMVHLLRTVCVFVAYFIADYRTLRPISVSLATLRSYFSIHNAALCRYKCAHIIAALPPLTHTLGATVEPFSYYHRI